MGVRLYHGDSTVATLAPTDAPIRNNHILELPVSGQTNQNGQRHADNGDKKGNTMGSKKKVSKGKKEKKNTK